MAVLSLNFESVFLGNDHPVSIILPECSRNASPRHYYHREEKYPVLWLLHPTCSDHTSWLRKTQIELYACERQIAVVMPNALNSNYANWDTFATGFQMYDYLTEELMPLVCAWFPISCDRKDNLIAGASMGGRGALLYGINHPELFGGIASFSCPLRELSSLTMLDPVTPFDQRLNKRALNSVKNAGGMEEYLSSYENTLETVRNMEKKEALPPMLFIDGERDEGIRMLEKKVQRDPALKRVNMEFMVVPGYGHEWRLWDKCLGLALDYFGFSVCNKIEW